MKVKVLSISQVYCQIVILIGRNIFGKLLKKYLEVLVLFVKEDILEKKGFNLIVLCYYFINFILQLFDLG